MQAEVDYLFSNNWFDRNKPIWSQLLRQLSPAKILEVGSYEGKSTAFIIESLANANANANANAIEVHCIDSWEGGVEHRQGGTWEADMTQVEARFARNMKIAMSKSSRAVKLELHKGLSNQELPRLVANGMQGYFDFVYIDGSHQAPDVLLDAILSFELLRIGGLMAFDDYLWQEPLPPGGGGGSSSLSKDIHRCLHDDLLQKVEGDKRPAESALHSKNQQLTLAWSQASRAERLHALPQEALLARPFRSIKSRVHA